MSSGNGEAAPSALLRVDHIEAGYGGVQVLFDVCLEVRRGEMVALLGTNGAGKSTLLRVVAGLLQPTRGRVYLNDQDMTGELAERRSARGISLVPGGSAVFPDLSVAENLKVFSHSVRHLDPAVLAVRMEAVFERFPRLRARQAQLAGSMSGGEQQQLGLARAILAAPKLLCIDELSLGLAPTVVASLLETVRAMHLAGTTVILVEQSLNVAAALCERAVFMEKGAIWFEGAPRDLLERDDIARAVFLSTGQERAR